MVRQRHLWPSSNRLPVDCAGIVPGEAGCGGFLIRSRLGEAFPGQWIVSGFVSVLVDDDPSSSAGGVDGHGCLRGAGLPGSAGVRRLGVWLPGACGADGVDLQIAVHGSLSC
jgi:hypothetical protein